MTSRWMLRCSSRVKISMASSSLLNSGNEWDIVQPCTLSVHATSVSPSQKPTVSPYHCEIKLTCFWPIRICRRMFSAVPESSCTWCGVTVI